MFLIPSRRSRLHFPVQRAFLPNLKGGHMIFIQKAKLEILHSWTRLSPPESTELGRWFAFCGAGYVRGSHSMKRKYSCNTRARQRMFSQGMNITNRTKTLKHIPHFGVVPLEASSHLGHSKHLHVAFLSFIP